ncbi:hypothetical protein RGQ29_008634 [Quercus rubra]|uniref:Uncharacterized protein n=1 Tax=Quercus rubra TaxID=3512 RepID=A0AAN7E0P7_QUERU|nr:hypothetical protein RGQ29_008634 [Quercus rubra]KAK4559493.1 hypothetical protein RGQ29_008634 [Quercus rubra]
MSILDDTQYWVQWQVPVCAFIVAAPAVLALRFVKKLKDQPLNYADLWTPCWKNFSPVWLLYYRAFAFVCLAWMLYEMVVFAGAFCFFFYTQWTFALVMVYFALGTIVSAYGCRLSSKKPHSKNGDSAESVQGELEEIQQKVGLWGYLMLITYQTCAGAVMLTDIVFWCILVPFLLGDQFSMTLLIGGIHSLNAVFLILDTALNRLPLLWSGFAYFVLWSCLYVTFQWVIRACGFYKWWPYPFLELNTPWAPIWYFSLALVHVLCYWIYVQIEKMKISVLPGLFPQAFVKSF